MVALQPHSGGGINNLCLGFRSVSKLPAKNGNLPVLVHTHCGCRQQMGAGLIPLQMAMNKTFIHMHIKRQELTKKYVAKQSCRACEKGRMERTHSKSLTRQLATARFRGRVGTAAPFIPT